MHKKLLRCFSMQGMYDCTNYTQDHIPHLSKKGLGTIA